MIVQFALESVSSLLWNTQAKKKPPSTPPNLRDMIRRITMLGGFLGRMGDGEPGVKTLWLGLARLRDFVRGVEFIRSVHADCDVRKGMGSRTNSAARPLESGAIPM
jgi:hypothetical protein